MLEFTVYYATVAYQVSTAVRVQPPSYLVANTSYVAGKLIRGTTMTNRYDAAIKAAAEKYLPGWDWRLYKAQLMAESAMDPNAVSSVGATGLAQFMPGTWADISKEMGLPKSAKPTDPKHAIPAGAYYMAKLLNSWTSPRPEMDRYCLAMASYNAGFGNLIKAQKAADGALDYATIVKSLHRVTGLHSHETIVYVKRILNYYNQMVTG